jgi:NMD protein affecting ribosome stability and mRNA decay
MERKNKLIQEYIHDPYFPKKKYSDPSVCERCGLVFNNGIFEWLDRLPKKAEKIICPACRKIADKYEGGVVNLEGKFLAQHRDEIVNIIKNTESVEMKQRPLERIIEVITEVDRIEIKTTYEHLARRIGEAIHKAYKGYLTLQYPESEKYVRVRWSRET